MQLVQSASGVQQASILVAPEHLPRFVLKVHAYPSDTISDGVTLHAVATRAINHAGIQHEVIGNGRGTLNLVSGRESAASACRAAVSGLWGTPNRRNALDVTEVRACPFWAHRL